MVTHSPAHADYAHRTVNLFDGHVVTDNDARCLIQFETFRVE